MSESGSSISKKLYTLWTGDNPMPERRLRALESLSNTGLDVCLITQHNLSQYIHPDAPIHECYPYLSAIHRADYMRTYLMHHFGGGYADIKFTDSDWTNAHKELSESDAYCVGYQEIGWRGVAIVRNPFTYARLLINHQQLIGNGAYLFRPQTALTYEWFSQLTNRLNYLRPALLKNPARHPEDYFGRNLDGSRSRYPVRWTFLLGDIFHPLCLKYASKIKRSLPMPSFNEKVD